MEARIITLFGHLHSEQMARRCIRSANIPVQPFNAVRPEQAESFLEALGLEWTWGLGYGPMEHKPYGGNELARKACFLSHYKLWQFCAYLGEPILILEHDAIFVRPFEAFDFDAICMINDPRRATPRGGWWYEQMCARGSGIWPKTAIFDDSRPDGLAGNSAYLIQPHAAQRLLEITKEVGAWPNDALICRQLIDGLQEVYPFITEVQAGQSTIQC